ANYISSQFRRSLGSETISTRNGKGQAKFRVNYPDWGRVYVRICDPVSNHCAGKVVYADWPGWAGRGKRDIPGGATMLTMSAEKEKYDVGENVRITLPGSENGRALVSIENGSRVLKTMWISTKKGENHFEFSATEEMSPNIYVSVSLLQPHNKTTNDRPVRLYGMTGVM